MKAILVHVTTFSCLLTAVSLDLTGTCAADWPMFGRDHTRNAVSPEKNPPLDWQVERRNKRGEVTQMARNIKWAAQLGSVTYGDPVVSNGLVWVGTNNRVNDPDEDASVLMCFREHDGKLLYKYISARLSAGRVHDWPASSLACSPLIEGDRIWFTTNRAEIVCLNIAALLRGAGEPHVAWKMDMIQQWGVFPRGSHMAMAHTCSPAGYRDFLYVITGNGVDYAGLEVPAPHAPSLVCLNKRTGKLIWQDNSPGENILFGQWASPLVAEIEGRAQCIAPQGDGWLRSFDALTGDLLWEFDMNPKTSVWQLGRRTRNILLGTPVLYENRVYLASGQHPIDANAPGRLCCIDPTKRGDISAELGIDAAGRPLPRRRLQAVIPEKGEKAIPNPNSGLVWEFTKLSDRFEDQLNSTVSSVAASDGLVIAADREGLVHCLDADSGKRYWYFDMLAAATGSPLIVDRKVFVGDTDGETVILHLSPDPQVSLGNAIQGQPVELSVLRSVDASPIYANGTLYVATRNQLLAIGATSKVTESDSRTSTVDRPNGNKRGRIEAAFAPTPHDVVEQMLLLAGATENDIVYDLGSGDGRIVIAAAKRHGCRAVGYEKDAELVKLSTERAQKQGVADRVRFEQQDLFAADLKEADVITLYLLPSQLEQLTSRLKMLKPGARIVAHHFAIPGVQPDRTVSFPSGESGETHTLYLWTTPIDHDRSR